MADEHGLDVSAAMPQAASSTLKENATASKGEEDVLSRRLAALRD